MSKKKTTTATLADGTTSEAGSAANEATRPKRTRPRAGCWTPISRQIPIPGCDDTADLDFYSVEFAGETIEVRRNRDGVKKANAWIKGIREREERLLKINRLRRELAEMEGMDRTMEPGQDMEPTT